MREKSVGGAASSLWVEEEGFTTGQKLSKEKNKKAEGGERSSRGVQLTRRDIDAIGWITEQYAVRTDVIRWLLATASRSATAERVQLSRGGNEQASSRVDASSPAPPTWSGQPGKGHA